MEHEQRPRRPGLVQRKAAKAESSYATPGTGKSRSASEYLGLPFGLSSSEQCGHCRDTHRYGSSIQQLSEGVQQKASGHTGPPRLVSALHVRGRNHSNMDPCYASHRAIGMHSAALVGPTSRRWSNTLAFVHGYSGRNRGERRGALWGINGAPERAWFQHEGAAYGPCAGSRNMDVGRFGAGQVKRACGERAFGGCYSITVTRAG